MTPEQREQLKQAAMKATPGKWDSDETRVYYPNMAGGFCLRQSPNPEANAKYIAAASPAVILSLIAQVEALTVPQGMSEKIELAWYCGYYHAGYTNDSAYAHMKAAEYAKEALSNSPEIEGIAAPTIPAIPGTKEGA